MKPAIDNDYIFGPILFEDNYFIQIFSLDFNSTAILNDGGQLDVAEIILGKATDLVKEHEGNCENKIKQLSGGRSLRENVVGGEVVRGEVAGGKVAGGKKLPEGRKKCSGVQFIFFPFQHSYGFVALLNLMSAYIGQREPLGSGFHSEAITAERKIQQTQKITQRGPGADADAAEEVTKLEARSDWLN
ncbi:hypothetical protein L218DRAFT_949500 [Marasmius fiardii PR-910]|nr:hypothetical protein L218DRAFT_949500 [Marasmius fiardii PR-910]